MRSSTEAGSALWIGKIRLDSTVWSLYPAGLLRQTADLDLVCPSAAGVWAVGRHLLSDGWSPASMFLVPVDGDVHVHTVMTRPSDQPMLIADEKIELTTVAYPGDHRHREPARCS